MQAIWTNEKRSNHACRIWCTLSEILSAIETIFRLYSFVCKARDHIPKDLSDFSLAELSGFVTFISSIHQNRNSQISIAYLFDWDSSLWCVVAVFSGQVHLDNNLVICGYHVKLGVPSALWFSDRLLSVFFKAPCASGCSLQEVLSSASTSTLIEIIFSCWSALKTRWITPFSHHLLRTCPHRDSCTSFRQILPVTALKILEGRQPVGGFLPCHRQNYAWKSVHSPYVDRF